MSKRIPILLGFFLLILAVWVSVTSAESVRYFLKRLDDITYDMQLHTKLFVGPSKQVTSVVIVDIDDKSLVAEGRWPWPRSKIAELVQQLHDAGVAVVAFDMMFAEKQENIADTVLKEITLKNLATPPLTTAIQKIAPIFDMDTKLAASLQQMDTVLGITFLPENAQSEGDVPKPLLVLNTPQEKSLDFISSGGFINDIPLLQKAAKSQGFINVFSDADGVVRRAATLIRYKDNIYPSLSLEAARLYLFGNIKLVTASYGNVNRLEGIQLGDAVIPTDARGEVIIPFRGPSGSFPYLSATDVLHKKFSADALQGKLVFVGTSAVGLGDLQATAVQTGYPGVEIHATIADAILKHNFPAKPAWSLGAEISITVLVGLILVFLFPYLNAWLLTVVTILVPAILIIINKWLLEKEGLLLSMLVPILLTFALLILNTVYGFFFESRRREYIKHIFGQYVAPGHIDEMLKGKSNFGLLGEEREMTVLFADIRNFTTISEPLKATEVKEMLGEFLTPMTQIIFDHQGTIDKYVGDMIMAFWGAPLKDSSHAQHGIEAALAMQAGLQQLRIKNAERGWPEIYIGVGLNSGSMNVGDMGSEFRRNYTVLGDAVNLASRLESLTKEYGVGIIVGEATYQATQQFFVFRQLDRVKVRGKKIGMNIYEVVCRNTELSDALRNEITNSQQALNFYFNQQWDKAGELFQQLNTQNAKSKFYSLYLQRIAQFRRNPPAEDWDGVYVYTQK